MKDLPRNTAENVRDSESLVINGDAELAEPILNGDSQDTTKSIFVNGFGKEESDDGSSEQQIDDTIQNGESLHVDSDTYYEENLAINCKDSVNTEDATEIAEDAKVNTNTDKDFDEEIEIPLLRKENRCNVTDINELKFSKSDLGSKQDRWFLDKDQTKVETPRSRTQSCLDDPPDGGWGWVVTFSAFMVGLILDGISFSFGLFFKELYVYFNESKSITSWIISVLNGTYLAIGPVSSVLVAIFGCRKVAIFGSILSSFAFFVCTWSPNVQVMILLYGLIGGTGLGQMYLPTIVTVGHYFKKRRALATGIAVCGSGIGGFVFAPLSQFLIERYTWKGAMWVISAIALNGVVVAALLRPLEHRSNYKGKRFIEETVEQTLTPVDADKRKCCDPSAMFDFPLLKSPTFLLYGAGCFLCMLGFFIPFTFIPDLVVDKGMSAKQGAILISLIGALNTVGRVLVGWVADRSWSDAVLINSVAVVIGGAATMFVPYYGSFGLLAVYSVVFGLAAAVFAALRPVILADLLGVAKLTSSFGLVTLCQGLASFIGAPIAGAVSDLTGNYKGAFFFAGATICLSGLICFPLRKISEWETRKTSDKRREY